jgi:hypothetical protein
MENKLYNIILIILMMTQTISCQEKAAKTNENHFLIKGEEIFYNDNKVTLGMPIDDFIKIVNSEHRIAKYSIAGGEHKEWFWKGKLHATTDTDKNGKEIVSVIKMKKYNGEQYIDDLSENYQDFSSIEDVIKKYGKYDSVKVEKVPDQESNFYVFDKLGFNVAIDEKNNTVSQINIYPLPYNKLYKEVKVRDITKGIGVGDDPLIQYVDADKKVDADNYKVMLERQPKTVFKGKFTYNDNTADFSLLNDKDWSKVVKDLKITGSDYNPPGDSKGWSRQIRADYEHCMIDIIRFNNKSYSLDSPSAEDVGEIDFVKSIEIWGSAGDDLK